MKGVLLINLGSPDSPEKKDVKKYSWDNRTKKIITFNKA